MSSSRIACRFRKTHCNLNELTILHLVVAAVSFYKTIRIPVLEEISRLENCVPQPYFHYNVSLGFHMKDISIPRAQRKSLAQAIVQSLLVFVTIIMTLISCEHKALQDKGTVTEKIIETYGGRERLARVVSISAEGRITALIRGDEGIYKRALRRDGKLFVDIHYTRSTERRILNGPKGYRGAGGQLEEVYGPRYLAMVYQYDELNLPYGLLDGSFTISEIRSDTLNGRTMRALRCTDRTGNDVEVFVDAENYRIVKSTGTFSMGNQSTSLSSEFSDFRSVDGVLFPFRIVNYAGGNRIAEIVITRYLVNPTIDDSLFTP